MKLLIISILLSGLLLQSCGITEDARNISEYQNVDVRLIFTVDGCKIYRFRELGWDSRYFSKCNVEGTSRVDNPVIIGGKTTTITNDPIETQNIK